MTWPNMHAIYRTRAWNAAIGFLDGVDAALGLLGQWPGIGTSCRFQNTRFDGIRVWPIPGFKNFLIFYRVLDNEVEIVRVIHGARDLSAIFGDAES